MKYAEKNPQVSHLANLNMLEGSEHVVAEHHHLSMEQAKQKNNLETYRLKNDPIVELICILVGLVREKI